jgi:hypothetical protein
MQRIVAASVFRISFWAQSLEEGDCPEYSRDRLEIPIPAKPGWGTN